MNKVQKTRQIKTKIKTTKKRSKMEVHQFKVEDLNIPET